MGGHIRLAVIDDHEMFLELLSRRLDDEDDLEVVAAARTGAEALETLPDDVDVALVDYLLPDVNGTELVRALTERSGARVVLITTVSDPQVMLEAIAVGCAGFVSKTSPIDEVLEAVRAVAAGESAIVPADLTAVLARARRAMTGRRTTLTERESDVLAQMVLGRSNRDIADALHLSVDTVRNHVSTVLRKLDSHSKLEAVVTAARRGLIDLGPDSD